MATGQCVHNVLSVCMPESQKWFAYLITDGGEPSCDSWELNSGPVERTASALNHRTLSLSPTRGQSDRDSSSTETPCSHIILKEDNAGDLADLIS